MKWRVYKVGKAIWRVDRPSAEWADRPGAGWAGDFESWDAAMAWATKPKVRIAFMEDLRGRVAFVPWARTEFDRLMWTEGLTP